MNQLRHKTTCIIDVLGGGPKCALETLKGEPPVGADLQVMTHARHRDDHPVVCHFAQGVEK